MSKVKGNKTDQSQKAQQEQNGRGKTKQKQKLRGTEYKMEPMPAGQRKYVNVIRKKVT